MRFRLTEQAREARVVSGGVQVMSRTLEFDTFRVLLAFEPGKTVEEVFVESGIDDTLQSFAQHVRTFEKMGLLQREGTQLPPEGPSLGDTLSPELQDPELLAQISGWLRQGRAVALPDALRPELAREVHEALEAHELWQPLEVFQPFFHYRVHHLEDETLFPPALRTCQALFGSTATRQFVSELTGTDCRGLPTFAASWYQPGDYSLPHSDAGQLRSVAFVWHLTRDWSPRWGGELYWCPTGRALSPQFNWLTLFCVQPGSTHMVCPVAPRAGSKRLAVVGWWNRLGEEPVTEPAPIAPMSPCIEGYAPSVEPIADGRVRVF
jgi:hypothetical protein